MSTPLHDDELDVDVLLVRKLLAEQCPDLAELELVEVESAGSSNWLFRVGDDKVVRLPRRPGSAEEFVKEHMWLPRLAPNLPLAIPAPLLLGQPSEIFPHHWSLLPWIEGHAAEVDQAAHSTPIARQLAEFIQALRAQDTTGGPASGAHNYGRGAPLAERDDAVRSCTRELEGTIDTDRALAIWDEALAAPQHAGPPTWLHGDLLASNLLITGDRLAAVIDFGLLGVGDPACDLLPAWALFDTEARATFRGALQPDDARWSRGRGWALSFALIALPYYGPKGHPLAVVATRTIEQILDEARRGAGKG